MDPMHSDTLTMRRKQLLDVLEQIGEPKYAELVMEMIAELDFERGFFILQSSMSHLQGLDEWSHVLRTFEKKHGKLAKGIASTLQEGVRRDVIKNMRGAISEPEHRFFLALLMNVSTRKDLLALVKQRVPDAAPIDTVLRWSMELLVLSDEGASILDACFPEALHIEIDDQPDLFLTAIRHFASGSKKVPTGLRACSDVELRLLREAFAESSLRVLVS
jgi:hypothetical protein